MSGFPIGDFDRSAVPFLLRRVCPLQSVETLVDVDLDQLHAKGKTLILLDVDNTLLPWRGLEIPATTRAWIAHARQLGFKMCILSNTRHPERLERLAGELDIAFRRGRFKPSTHMYQMALDEFGVEADEAVMIGDQLFTDVLGANRAGIDSVWVRPMTGRDFIGTKVSRMGEFLVRRTFHRALRKEGDLMQNGAVSATSSLMGRPVVRQFIKFCIVGGTSTVIDVGLHYVLMFVLTVNGELLSLAFGRWLLTATGSVAPDAGDATQISFTVFKVVSASVAILNSFIWNRRWTFRIRGKEDRHRQLVKFVAVAVIGMVLNTLIASGLNSVIPGHPKRSWAIATAVATVAVAFWNFMGQKLWTFRAKPQ
ncbi:MAG: YqeG family HAD IIIA-type phosphatase [Fimbriimonadaceae bacterium]|nr:YqeG family HAD IIIA-type phosphatase [Fimbriimonadaceae bacterium]